MAHVALRAWFIGPSWFFLDDFNLLADADRSLSWDYLLTPYNGHLMPGGRLTVWIVAQQGLVDWSTAAIITLAWQALAAVALWWALHVLFGPSWGLVALLAVGLTTTLAVPSFIWWAAALNLVPIQFAGAAAVGAWVLHLRTGRLRWLVASVAAVALGLFFWVKAILVLPVLALLALGWFREGTGVSSVLRLLRSRLVAVLAFVGLAGVYLALYLARADDQFESEDAVSLPALLDTMIGTAFGSAAAGGPWRWAEVAPPTAYADPPDSATHLAWVVISLVILLAWARRSGTLKAWGLLVVYLALQVGLLYTSRAQDFGAQLGLEYRYLADVVLIVVLAVGLATMRLVDAPGSSAPRPDPWLRVAVPPALVAAVTVIVATGGLVSSWQYATFWHEDNAGQQVLGTVREEVQAAGSVELADQVMPEDVMSQLAAPSNNSSFLIPLVTDGVTFPETSSRLTVIGEGGHLHDALIGNGVRSPSGPVDGCGWRVRDRGLTIPLDGEAFDSVWWMRIGYLYSADSPVTVTADDQVVDASVQPGVNSLYVRVEGSFSEVRIDGIADGTVMCVDSIEVGTVAPGARR